MSDIDGNNLVQLSKLISNPWTPRWSPDGKKIAFDSRRSGNREIYVVDISEQVPRKLVTNVRRMSTPNWSRDGKWIYFMSYETLGNKFYRIYRCPATGGNAVALGSGTFPQESFDGNVLYFATRNVNTGLSMLSLNGAFPEAAVGGVPPIVEEELWTVVPGGDLFRAYGRAQVPPLFRFLHKTNSANLRSPAGLWRRLVRLAGRSLAPLFTGRRVQQRHHAGRPIPVARPHIRRSFSFQD
jgi:WD40-like Beta Propeller Repeat